MTDPFLEDISAAEREWLTWVEEQRRRIPLTPGWFRARKQRRRAWDRFLTAYLRAGGRSR